MLAICPFSAPYSALQGERGLMLLILPGYMDALGLQMCAALTAGPCLSSEQTTAAAVLLLYGKCGKLLEQMGTYLLFAWYFCFFSYAQEYMKKNKPTLLLHSKQ